MELITRDKWHIEGHTMGCTCEMCCFLRLWHLKEQVESGKVNEGIPGPGTRVHFARWLYAQGKITEGVTG